MPGSRVQLLYMLMYGSLYCSAQVNGDKVTVAAPVAQVRNLPNDYTGSRQTNAGINNQPPPGKLTVLVFINFYLDKHRSRFLGSSLVPLQFSWTVMTLILDKIKYKKTTEKMFPSYKKILRLLFFPIYKIYV